jgi:phage terminase large subunit-like protein
MVERLTPSSAAISSCEQPISRRVAVARAQAVSPQVESGNVYLPHPSIAPWVEPFVEECATFPNGKYDDQVDQMSQALNRLRAMGSAPTYSSPMPRPPTGDRGWMA